MSDKNLKIGIVGAGIQGVCNALFLQKKGYQVILFDRDEPGNAASYGNAGHFSPYASVPLNRPDILSDVPAMLMSSRGPLALKWNYVPKMIPWFSRFMVNCTKDKMMQGELGEMYAERMPKIKIVHMLVDVNGQREFESIKHLTKFAEETGWDYEQMVNDAYTELPPKDTCARPDAVQMEPGEYKLAPAHYGNFLAHRTAIETHLTDDYDAVLFCECDAIFMTTHFRGQV